MELPFKYIVLSIIKMLNDRNMTLVINKNILVDYIKEIMSSPYFTREEKIQIGKNFNFVFELDDLFDKYYQYFDIDDDVITFDSEYINELNNLINNEINESDLVIIHDIDFIISGDSRFLEILGIDIKKELYNFLLDIEKELENCYDELGNLEGYVGIAKVDTKHIIDKIKKVKLKKIVMLLNTKNLLSNFEYRDLMLYASNIADRTNDFNDLFLLIEDDQFNESDIMGDVFLRSIFTGSDSYISNLRDSLIINYSDMFASRKNSRIKFYYTFLELLEREIDNSFGFLNMELIKIKYRIMNVMDSVYGTSLFMNNAFLEDMELKKDYYFIYDAVYYFANEILMYDDEKYNNKDTGVENTMIYLDNIMKKLLIEVYYKLTKDMKIVEQIKKNELYGVNGISSAFLKDIIDKPKTKIKEI